MSHILVIRFYRHFRIEDESRLTVYGHFAAVCVMPHWRRQFTTAKNNNNKNDVVFRECVRCFRDVLCERLRERAHDHLYTIGDLFLWLSPHVVAAHTHTHTCDSENDSIVGDSPRIGEGFCWKTWIISSPIIISVYQKPNDNVKCVRFLFTFTLLTAKIARALASELPTNCCSEWICWLSH